LNKKRYRKNSNGFKLQELRKTTYLKNTVQYGNAQKKVLPSWWVKIDTGIVSSCPQLLPAKIA